MNMTFFRQRIKRGNTPNISVKWREANIIKRWMKCKDLSHLRKYENCPELIVLDYENYLKENIQNIPIQFTPEERLSYMKQLLEWHLHVQPEFRKFLQVVRINNAEFGKLLGYSSGSSWYNMAKSK
jgi:antirestriction protein